MSHPLARQVASVGRRVRILWLLHALGLVTAIFVVLAICLIAADYAIRVEDRGIRIMESAAFLAAGIWALYRFLWRAVRARLKPVQIAMRLERRFPSLRDRLASSIEFLNERADDPRSGSAELRRTVIHETAQLAERIDLAALVDQRPVIRALLAAMTACLLAGVLTALEPRLAFIGARRLLDPLGSDKWPQQTHLELKRVVQRLATGQPFEVEVIDRNHLPNEVWMLYRQRQPDGGFHEEKQLLPVISGTAVARRERVTRPFAYRAIGGDDQSMPWNEVEVIEPPALAALHLMLHFPPYTAYPNRASDKQLRAIVGTRVAIDGAATKPLRSGKVVYEDGREIPLAIAADRTHFSLPVNSRAPLVIDKTGAYWFVLEDMSGLQGGADTHYEMRAVPDLEPSVTIDAPPINALATPNAVIPIAVTATDDLAIRRIALSYARTDQSDKEEQTLPLFQGPEAPAPPEHADQGGKDHGERRTASHRWELGPLALSPGTQLTIQAIAFDYRPAIGRSTSRQISIVTPEELERRIEDREAALLAELSHALQLEQSARSHVAAIQIQTEQVGTVQQGDLDRLHAAALAQRQVDRALTSREDGVPGRVAGLLADLANNQLDNPELKRRADSILAEVERLAREHLPRIEPALTAAEKSIKSSRKDDRLQVSAEARTALGEGGRSQDQVIISLQRLLGDLTQWDSQRRLVRELSDLRQAQEEVASRTAQTGRATLSKNLTGLTAQQQADLNKLAAEQQALARRLEVAQQNMAGAGQQLERDSPLDAQSIADALARMSEQSLAAKMRESAANIEQNQIGQANAQQKQSAEDLKELVDILSNRREHELARLVKKLKEAEKELNSLRAAQAQLQKRLDGLVKESDSHQKSADLERLTKEQRQLEQQAARVARKLQRLQAEQSAAALARASGRMGQAGERAEQGDATDAAEAARQAGRDLDEAQDQLAERRRQAERDLAIEQFAKIRDSITGLRDRQHQAIQETERLDGLRKSNGKFSRAQAESVLDAANAQETLATEAQTLARRISVTEAFGFALANTSRDMSAAAAHLRDMNTGVAAAARQQRAQSRLEQLLGALAPEKTDQESGKASDGGDAAGGGGSNGPPGEQIPELAQLKLIKLMQEDLNRRTLDLTSTASEKSKNEDAAAAFTELGEEQGRLADVIRNLGGADNEQSPDEADELRHLLEDKVPRQQDAPEQSPNE